MTLSPTSMTVLHLHLLCGSRERNAGVIRLSTHVSAAAIDKVWMTLGQRPPPLFHAVRPVWLGDRLECPFCDAAGQHMLHTLRWSKTTHAASPESAKQYEDAARFFACVVRQAVYYTPYGT